MDWIKTLKECIGITDEGTAVDLNDMEGREILTVQHLRLLMRDVNSSIKNDEYDI